MPPLSRKVYFFSADQDERVRRSYAEHAHNREALGEAITALAKHMKCPRYIIFNRAAQLRVRTIRGKNWTAKEVQFLRDNVGIKPLAQIRRALKRGHSSVISKIADMQLSRRVLEGYSREDLASSFCVSKYLVSKWISSSWLIPDRDTDRVPESSVRRFISKHPEQYSLKRVDEAWFKGMIFPAFGQHAHGMGDDATHNPYQEIA
jgi:hypothetical protein